MDLILNNIIDFDLRTIFEKDIISSLENILNTSDDESLLQIYFDNLLLVKEKVNDCVHDDKTVIVKKEIKGGKFQFRKRCLKCFKLYGQVLSQQGVSAEKDIYLEYDNFFINLDQLINKFYSKIRLLEKNEINIISKSSIIGSELDKVFLMIKEEMDRGNISRSDLITQLSTSVSKYFNKLGRQSDIVKNILKLDNQSPENSLKIWFKNLSPFKDVFNIYEEVAIEKDGQIGYIDFIVDFKDEIKSKFGQDINYNDIKPFGIEVKYIDIDEDKSLSISKQYSELLAQCIDYSNARIIENKKFEDKDKEIYKIYPELKLSCVFHFTNLSFKCELERLRERVEFIDYNVFLIRNMEVLAEKFNVGKFTLDVNELDKVNKWSFEYLCGSIYGFRLSSKYENGKIIGYEEIFSANHKILKKHKFGNRRK